MKGFESRASWLSGAIFGSLFIALALVRFFFIDGWTWGTVLNGALGLLWLGIGILAKPKRKG